MSETKTEEDIPVVKKPEGDGEIRKTKKIEKNPKRFTRRMSRLSLETFVPKSHSRIKNGPLPKNVPTLTTK